MNEPASGDLVRESRALGRVAAGAVAAVPAGAVAIAAAVSLAVVEVLAVAAAVADGSFGKT